MARPKKAPAMQEAPLIPSHSLVASAVRYPALTKVPRIHHPSSKQWQAECYRHYAICGEARFAARFFGHALSRAILKTSRMVEGTVHTVEDGIVHDLLQELFNGKDGQSQMLASAGIHLTIAGEFYLVGRTVAERDDEGNELEDLQGQRIGNDVWEIISVMEMEVQGGRWSIRQDGYQPIELAEDDVVIRVWNPNPARRMEADSPFRSLLPTLTEIEWLTRHVFAQTSSRLAGAGILFLPQGMTFPPPTEREGQDVGANEADSFMLALADHMLTPLDDPSSPASKVPIIVTAPEDSIDKARLMTFWSELDSASMSLRQEAIQRFALGMDLPPEQILGMSSNGGTGGGSSNGVSHWGAWQVEEATIKMHVEPMLDLIVNAITISYIRPLASDTGDFVTYDSSALRLRPDRSKEAMELWLAGAIGTDTMLVENGFEVTDAPTPDELKMHFLRKIAAGSATPEQVEAALDQLGIALRSSRFGEQPDDTTPRETRPDPSLDEHPTRPRTPGEGEPGVDPALLAACDSMVYRALEKAGNRVINAGKRGKERDRSLDPVTVHCSQQVNGEGPGLLADAWSFAPRVLDGLDCDPVAIVDALNTYVLDLFETQREHERDSLEEYLEVWSR